MPATNYDSENEDQPRRVVDTDGYFTVLNSNPPVTFKPRDKPMGLIMIRPVPSPALVQRARAAMGSGNDGVWVGTVFATNRIQTGSRRYRSRHAVASRSRTMSPRPS